MFLTYQASWSGEIDWTSTCVCVACSCDRANSIIGTRIICAGVGDLSFGKKFNFEKQIFLDYKNVFIHVWQ